MNKKDPASRASESRRLTRRDFLRMVGVAAAGAITSRCMPSAPETPAGKITLPPLPTGTPVIQQAATTLPQVSRRVAIAQAASYDPGLIRKQMLALLDGIGGLDDVIHPGDRVVIKVNLTGGNFNHPYPGFTPAESYMTHPQVVRALCERLRDAGAGRITIVESFYDAGRWGYDEIARDLQIDLVDLNKPEPYSSFVQTPVGEGWFVYDKFLFNRILEEADTFISVAKMKCHYNCGVTLSMKNLIGLVPVAHYRQNGSDWWRSGLHGNGNEANKRLPRIILDLNRARPIHLSIIDGIKTAEGGEVPRGTFKPVQPGVLLAGKNAVATDAVATTVMAFDPTVNPPEPPFLRGDNYLNMATKLGLGTNQLESIQVVGASIDAVRTKFNPAREM